MGEDVASAHRVGRHPVAKGSAPPDEGGAVGPAAHVGEIQGEVVGGSDHAAQIEQLATGECGVELVGLVGRAEAAEGDEVGARCDGIGGVELDEREPPHHVEQIGGTLGGEELRPDHHPPRLVDGEVVVGSGA